MKENYKEKKFQEIHCYKKIVFYVCVIDLRETRNRTNEVNHSTKLQTTTLLKLSPEREKLRKLFLDNQISRLFLITKIFP